MSEPNVSKVVAAISEDSRRGPLARPLFIARVIAICTAVVGAVPTATDLYHSWQHDIPFKEVSHRLSQYNLWLKNIDCKVEYRSLNAGQGIRIDAGACPKSRDVALKLTTQDGGAAHEWIAFDMLQKASKAKAKTALWSLIVAEAAAGEAPPSERAAQSSQPAALPRLAQGAIQVQCQSLQGRSQIVRITNEGGKCYREVVSPYQGRVEKREEVPCNTQCPPSKS